MTLSCPGRGRAGSHGVGPNIGLARIRYQGTGQGRPPGATLWPPWGAIVDTGDSLDATFSLITAKEAVRRTNASNRTPPWSWLVNQGIQAYGTSHLQDDSAPAPEVVRRRSRPHRWVGRRENWKEDGFSVQTGIGGTGSDGRLGQRQRAAPRRSAPNWKDICRIQEDTGAGRRRAL